jgi:hypothetical protein
MNVKDQEVQAKLVAPLVAALEAMDNAGSMGFLGMAASGEQEPEAILAEFHMQDPDTNHQLATY